MQPNPAPRLEVLDYDECTRLLSSAVIGRLAWVGPAGPLLVPVNFVWTGTTILIRTDPGARLPEIIGHPVAFEIDELDPDHRLGWSVVVTGAAQLGDVNAGTDTGGPLRSWAPGSKPVCVEVVPRNISGRRLVPATNAIPATSAIPTPANEPPDLREPADLNPFWRMSAYS
jgi:uncharacterized protein